MLSFCLSAKVHALGLLKDGLEGMSCKEAEEIVTSESVAGGGWAADAAEKAGDGSRGAEGGLAFVSELLDRLDVLECDLRLRRAWDGSFALGFDGIKATPAMAAVFG